MTCGRTGRTSRMEYCLPGSLLQPVERGKTAWLRILKKYSYITGVRYLALAQVLLSDAVCPRKLANCT